MGLNVSLDTLIINLSYTDITTFIRIYYLNKFLIDKEKKLNNNFNNNEINSNPIDNLHNSFHRLLSKEILEKNILFNGNFFFENFNITFIDNSSGSYYPFAKVGINKINLTWKPDNLISSYYSLLLYSYNYISCVWEPTIEKVFIQF